MKIAAISCVFAVTVAAQVTAPPPQPVGDPAYAPLTQAFDALRAHDYDAAVALFRQASALSPQRADIRKNLAYTLLKTGDSDNARDQFGEAMRADPSDYHVALEYAFLCFEAKDDAPARKAEARRIFAAVRDHAVGEIWQMPIPAIPLPLPFATSMSRLVRASHAGSRRLPLRRPLSALIIRSRNLPNSAMNCRLPPPVISRRFSCSRNAGRCCSNWLAPQRRKAIPMA